MTFLSNDTTTFSGNVLVYTLKLLLIAATNFSDFSEKPHNR